MLSHKLSGVSPLDAPVVLAGTLIVLTSLFAVPAIRACVRIRLD
jgi:hypothetical protein